MQLVCINTGKVLLTAAEVSLMPINYIEGYLNCNLDEVEWQNVD